MPPDRKAWTQSFAKQSLSDFEMYSLLLKTESVVECHRLHYLQMACEKIGKAYLCRDTATDLEEMLTSHIALTKVVENLLKSSYIQARFTGTHLERMNWKMRRIAREIEKLAPAVDRDASPANAEYPWEEGDTVVTPCEYAFPNLRLLLDPEGRQFLKLMEVVILNFDDI